MAVRHNNVVANPRVSVKEADAIVTIVNSTPDDEAWNKSTTPWTAKKSLSKRLNRVAKGLNHKDVRDFLTVAESFFAKRQRSGCWVTDRFGVRRCVVLYLHTIPGKQGRSAVWFDVTPASLAAKIHVLGSSEDKKRSYIGQQRAAALQLPRPLWLNVCYECGNVEEPNMRHKTCSGCEDAKYCNASCQLSHWKVHRSICKVSSSTHPFHYK